MTASQATDRAAFLQAIADDFDNDTPRLVFADFLEENGEPERAEFIRVQCELAREKRICTPLCYYPSCRYCSLERKATHLLSLPSKTLKHYPNKWGWLGECRLSLPHHTEYRRGFPFGVATDFQSWELCWDRSEEASELNLIRRVVLSDIRPVHMRFVVNPELSLIGVELRSGRRMNHRNFSVEMLRSIRNQAAITQHLINEFLSSFWPSVRFEVSRDALSFGFESFHQWLRPILDAVN